jgi:hypothetical protein
MKIIRYLDSDRQVRYASLQADGTAREISGDLFGEFSTTDRPATVGKLLAPLAPTAFLCIGLNYRHHAAESKAAIPEFPVLFMKNAASVQNPNDPILLPRDSEGLYLLQRIRDEAHRFAIGYHRRLRDKAGLESRLDDVPGIGPRRRQALLKHFGSLEAIRAASVDELSTVARMTKTAAETLKERL